MEEREAMQAIETRSCRRVHWSTGRSVWIAPITSISAGLASAAIYAVASALGAIPHDVLVSGLGGKEPLTLGLVVSTATLAATLAIVVFSVMEWRSKQPIRLFRIVALIVLVASLASPFSIAGATGGMIAALIAMHVTVAAVVVGLLTLPRLTIRLR
jgi:hypothetical protein